MINVNCKNQRMWLFEKEGTIRGSILVSGGKDAKGNFKEGDFLPVKFSNACQDEIWDKFGGNVPNEATFDCSGFIAVNSYNDKNKDGKLIKFFECIITKIEKVDELEEKVLSTRKRGSK